MRNNSKLNILIANYSLNKIGGTESYTFAFVEELLKAGHEVEYFCFIKGEISEKIENELGISFLSKKKYDIIYANHNVCVQKLWKYGFIVQTCHGTFMGLESPSKFADILVSISEEVQQHLKKNGIDSFLIYNGINTDKFKPVLPINKKLKTVLSLAQSDEANRMIKRACSKLEIKFLNNNKFVNPDIDIFNRINQSDLVIGLGRSIFDGMSCGRPVIVFDYRGYIGKPLGDGYLTRDVFYQSIRNNCSGRALKIEFDEKKLIQELEKYNSADGIEMRKIAIELLNIKNSVSEYLNLNRKKSEMKKSIFKYTRLLIFSSYLDILKIKYKVNTRIYNLINNKNLL